MPRNFEQQLPPTFQLSKNIEFKSKFYLKSKGLANYNITLKSYRNKYLSWVGHEVWSQSPPIHDVTSLTITTLRSARHITSLDVASYWRCWFASTSSTLHHVNFFDVVDTSSRHEHIPEIKIRLWKASEFTILNFEITFFLKTDKLKSAFKLRLTSPGRKL